MTILDRYIFREFFKWFFLTMLSFTFVYLIVDFFGRIRMFLSNGATFVQTVEYFGYSIPQVISHTMPVSVLLASLLAFSVLSRNNEIIAMKSSGVSLYRASVPLLAAAVVISAFSFLFNEFITPHANQKAKYIKIVDVQKQQKRGVFKQNQIWHRSKNAIYNFAYFDPGTNSLRGISINYFDRDFKLTTRIDAREARWVQDRWVLSQVLTAKFPENAFPELETAASKEIDLPETPSDLNAVQKDTDEMGFFELREFIHKIRADGYDAGRYLADLHGKIAFIMVNIILVILGISFSLKSERSGGVALSIGTGIIIGFSYWIVFAFTLSMGRSLRLSPFLAAWSANMILGAVAAFLYLRIKT